jgi:hypothetical protein
MTSPQVDAGGRPAAPLSACSINGSSRRWWKRGCRQERGADRLGAFVTPWVHQVYDTCP